MLRYLRETMGRRALSKLVPLLETSAIGSFSLTSLSSRNENPCGEDSAARDTAGEFCCKGKINCQRPCMAQKDLKRLRRVYQKQDSLMVAEKKNT